MIYDGHVHTPFCPHGTTDNLEEYVRTAINLGYSGLTFTEHAPLPKNFNDPAPAKDSAMDYEKLGAYFQSIKELKEEYKGQIQINTGLEIDFIEGYENETELLLKEVSAELDDAILSVHFLEIEGTFYCMDFDEHVFGEMVERSGSIGAIYDHYFNTLLKSVKHRFNAYQPNRIGHITLVKKFQKIFPTDFDYRNYAMVLLAEIKKRGFTLDYNGAGDVKPHCKEPYPDDWIVQEAIKRKIPLIYGSDAHSVKGLGQGFERLIRKENLTSPLFLNRAE